MAEFQEPSDDKMDDKMDESPSLFCVFETDWNRDG